MGSEEGALPDKTGFTAEESIPTLVRSLGLVAPAGSGGLGQPFSRRRQMNSGAYRILADLVLVTHVGFVAYVVVGLVVILWGGCRGWRWIRNPWFRATHLAGIGVVVAQSWLGAICPLTAWEMHLREKAGDPTYGGTFISHWLQRLLYYEAPPWVFTLCYTLFGLAVVISWVWFRPRPFRREARGD